MFKCFNLSIFRCSNVQMLQCSNVRMFKCSNVQMFRCSNAQTLRYSNVQIFKGSNVQMLNVMSSSDHFFLLLSNFFTFIFFALFYLGNANRPSLHQAPSSSQSPSTEFSTSSCPITIMNSSVQSNNLHMSQSEGV